MTSPAQQECFASQPTANPVNASSKSPKAGPAASEKTDHDVAPLAKPVDMFSNRDSILPDRWGAEFESPEGTAGWWSRLTFGWMTPVFRVGWKRHLDAEDVWRLGPSWRVASLSAEFDAAWQQELLAEKERAAAPEPDPFLPKSRRPRPPRGASLWRAMYHSWFWRMAPIGILKFTSDMATMFSPLMAKYILDFVANSRADQAGQDGDYPRVDALPPIWNGYALGLRDVCWGDGERSLSLGIVTHLLHPITILTRSSLFLLPLSVPSLRYAFGLYVMQILASLLLNYFFQVVSTQGMALRAALTSTLYRKSLRLSASARKEFNVGKVMTIVATDTTRVETFLLYVHLIWTAPVQVFVLTVLICSQLGLPALAGIAILVLFSPIQSRLMRSLGALRREVAPITDSRVKLFSEILQGMRVIKFFGWEEPFLEKVEGIRAQEVQRILKRSLTTAFITAIAFGIPVLSASVAIVIYGATNSLDPTKVFPALTWFGQLRVPLMFLPQGIVAWADFRVALDRISRLLLAPELDPQPPIDPDADHAVSVTNADFAWDVPDATASAATPATPSNGDSKLASENSNSIPAPELPLPTLRNITLAIPHGALTAIVGAVGSGKSSLLNALIGEMKCTAGAITLAGSLGYCPQQAWIQNASLRDNILFGKEFDRTRYLEAVRDCALIKDLEVLPDGDLTRVGEKGVNLS
ncbi:ABC transporter type 1, transmembrane domain-containing protein, partial [Blyttiomyces helicus]